MDRKIYFDDLALENKVNAVNAVHRYINRLVPELLKELKKGFKVNANKNDLFKRDKDKLKKIIADTIKPAYHIGYNYISVSEFRITLKTQGKFDSSNTTWGYFSKEVTLASNVNKSYDATHDYQVIEDFEPLPIYDLGLVKSSIEEINNRIDEISSIKSRIYEVKHEINSIVYESC